MDSAQQCRRAAGCHAERGQATGVSEGSARALTALSNGQETACSRLPNRISRGLSSPPTALINRRHPSAAPRHPVAFSTPFNASNHSTARTAGANGGSTRVPGAKKMTFFKVVPRPLGMLKQVFLARFEPVVARFGPWKISLGAVVPLNRRGPSTGGWHFGTPAPADALSLNMFGCCRRKWRACRRAWRSSVRK